MSGLKETELRTLARCCVCNKLIGKKPLPIFWKVVAERHLLDPFALARQTGLAMLLGGNGVLASAMGPNEDMTKLMQSATRMVCDGCMIERLPELFEEEEDA